MTFSCKYTSDGRIVEWTRGNSLAGLQRSQDMQHSQKSIHGFGIVSRYPDEVLQHPEQWALANLRIKCVNSNGTVEVELG